ncbi:hypothetical protein Tco_0300996 [Tanacetum coccineum]
MSNMSEDIQYAGSDTRPPMLDRTDFESWQQRIRLYCLGKDNGENIMKSITEGPFKMGTFIQTPAEETEGALQPGPERAMLHILIGFMSWLATEPKTIQKAVQFAGTLTDEALRNGLIKKNPEKRVNIGEPNKDRNGRDDNKST